VGYSGAFGVAAALASLSIPYYLWVRRSQNLVIS
jgi:hypothetical protein